MFLLDYVLSEFRWYRRWRGGLWQYASCPDGGWLRQDDPQPEFSRAEDYR